MTRRLLLVMLAATLGATACSSTSTVVSPPASTISPETTSDPSTTVTGESAAPSTDPASTSSSTTSTTVPPTTTVARPASETDRYTASSLESIDEFMSFARTGVAKQAVVKFSIPDFHNSESVEWLDSNFYELHDEWYWFQLLNGHAIDSARVAPVDGLSFESIDEIYDWALDMPPSALPLDLEFVGSGSPQRLYSPEFYRLALSVEPRVFGLGSLIRFSTNNDADDPTGDRWLIELQYTDRATPADVERFFERLIPTLAPKIGENLEWVVRSPQQARVAEEMAANSLPYADRTVRYSELVPRGEVAVYNEGITAGRLLLVEEGEAQLTDATDTSIVIIEDVPDWLPPASGLITSSPQTPLAHVNLLARNRGIPNASQAGILDDAEIRQAARVRAPAIIRAGNDGSLDVVLITNAQYDLWRSKQSQRTISVPPVSLEQIPLALPLDELATTIESETDVDEWRPIIGGKSAGFLSLLGADGVTTLQAPLAVTVRPYMEHLALVQDALSEILSNVEFANSARTRFLVLEGPDDYAEQYPDTNDAEFAAAFTEKHPPGTLLGDVLAAGGFARYFRDVPMDPDTLDELTQILEAQFGAYAATQGLRFRSSSSVEDIEGFSGAGLYDSNTGFLDPLAQPDEDDHKKTIERTIKKTWASYWGFEAFEERRRERVSHTSGAMGVLVHARFDDSLELNNGVATFTLLPDTEDDTAVLNINVQLGAESVTNPDPINAELPEVIMVRLDGGGGLTIEREANSTLSPDTAVLSDAAVAELVGQLEAVATLWRDRVNTTLPAEQQIETLTLDYEFKTMTAGWPALADGTELPGRLVVKQARSLDPGLRGVPDDVLDLDIPRDVLARARRVVTVTCDGVSHVEVLTDPLIFPDVGYSEDPLVIGERGTASDCETEVLYTTATQYLVELLAAYEANEDS